jgi:antitoxin component YwqK of YwqJK toxin-antitoxin module
VTASAEPKVIREMHPNGTVQCEYTEVGGQIEGYRRYWYPTGQLLSEAEYVHGVPHGKMREWTEGGCYVYQRLARMVFSTAHTRVGGMMGNQRNRASSKTEHVSLDTVGIVRTVPSGKSSKLLTFGAHLFGLVWRRNP